MNLHYFRKVVPLAILALSTAMISSCSKKKGGLPQNDQFPVVAATASDVEMNSSYPAAIKGSQDVEIRPKVSGFITKLCVEEGATVKAGQTLFTIDDVQYKAALNQAEAGLAAAQTGVATAELTYKNKKELHSQNIIGDFDLQTAANNLATAKANLAQAQAAVSAARDNLRYCNVTSPSNGVIGTIPYRVGSLVNPSIVAPMATVSNIAEVYVYFSVTEKQLLELTRSGKAANAFPAVRLKLADGSIYDHPGKVNAVSGVIDQASGSVSVRADFANPDRLLKSGGTGSILVPFIASGVIVIPQSATVEVQNKKFVYVLGKDNKVKYTEIEVNAQNDGDNYIVTSGLKVGDKYVTNGITKLTDGMEIQPLTPAQYQKNIEDAKEAGASQSSAKGFINTMTGGKK